jgi:hypothetical protein
MRTWRRTFALILVLAGTPAVARAQVSLGGGVTVGGEVTATFGAHDDIHHPNASFFNYTDYAHDALRMFRVSLSAMWRPIDQLAFLAEVRSEDLEHPIPYALYVRVRPWKERPFDIQVGRIPAVFGTFSRRYNNDNPLIGLPLAYQYLTSLRPDAIPASADDLLNYRGRGWEVAYPVPDPNNKAQGVPIITAYKWDTGIEMRGTSHRVEGAFAVTSGTLANPRVDDDNKGRQLSGRVAVTPVVGLVVGASLARGEFLAHQIAEYYEPVFPGAHYQQRALGVDGEYSRGYWIVRGELIESRWTLPAANRPFITNPLRATAGYVEARYRITPRVFAATRVDHMTFSTITGVTQPLESAGGVPGTPTPWDAPVTRIETGGGVQLTRHLTARGVVQWNWRERPVRFVGSQRTYLSGQLSFWF